MADDRNPVPATRGRRRTALGVVLFLGLVLAAGVVVWRMQPIDEMAPARQLQTIRSEAAWGWRWIDESPRLQSLLPRAIVQRAIRGTLEPDLRRMGAVQRLEKLGTNAWGIVPDLVETLESPNPGAGIAAGESLARIRAENSPAWRDCARALEGRPGAARAFGHLLTGRNSAGHSYDDRHRRFALIGLEATGEAGAAWREAVAEIAGSGQEPGIRSVAIGALSRVAPVHVETQALFRRVLDNAQDWPEVRAAAVLGLVRVSPTDAGVRERLRQALEDTSAQVRVAAVRALWQAGVSADEVLPTLASMAGHRLASIRLSAVRLAAEMGSLAAPIRGAIERLEEDPEESVRAAVAAWRRGEE